MVDILKSIKKITKKSIPQDEYKNYDFDDSKYTDIRGLEGGKPQGSLSKFWNGDKLVQSNKYKVLNIGDFSKGESLDRFGTADKEYNEEEYLSYERNKKKSAKPKRKTIKKCKCKK